MRLFIITILVLLFVINGCTTPEEEPYPQGATVLSVTGMDCAYCERDVEIAVFKARADAVTWVRANRHANTVGWLGNLRAEEAAAAINKDMRFYANLDKKVNK